MRLEQCFYFHHFLSSIALALRLSGIRFLATGLCNLNHD
ncbi:hypothetical protein X971_0906 [Agrobacterium tumefaciens LBA4213 (Ach5)]|nr:hypothetical protein X971_0906 [Agrobacterium tumefaciens LBA4213 (Ach5)]